MMSQAMKQRTTLFSASLAAVAVLSAFSRPALAQSPQAIAPAPTPATTSEERVTVDARDADVRSLLALLFNETGQDYTLDPGVQGYVTLKATNVPLGTTVRLVARGNAVPLTATENNRLWAVKPAEMPTSSQQVTRTANTVIPIVKARTIYEVPRRVSAVLLKPGHEAAILINGPEKSLEARTRTIHVGDQVPSGVTGIEPLAVVSINAQGVTLTQPGNHTRSVIVPLKGQYNSVPEKY